MTECTAPQRECSQCRIQHTLRRSKLSSCQLSRADRYWKVWGRRSLDKWGCKRQEEESKVLMYDRLNISDLMGLYIWHRENYMLHKYWRWDSGRIHPHIQSRDEDYWDCISHSFKWDNRVDSWCGRLMHLYGDSSLSHIWRRWSQSQEHSA